jgi:fatty-acyl-CoA synthase
MLQSLKREYRYLRGALRTLKMTTPIAKNPARVFPFVLEDVAAKFADREALVSDHERYTYAELNARANRYARWGLAQGLKKGDVVCLLMQNRPEYFITWLGLTRIGVVVGLLNTHITHHALAHCITIVKPKHLIVAGELVEHLRSAEPHLGQDAPKLWLYGGSDTNLPRLDQILETFDGGRLSESERAKLTIEDKALFIYTSGTTGLPKAANFNHYRLMAATHGFAGAMGTRPEDRMYDTLPMYHTNGGVLATGGPLLAGGSVVIRERFSSREFWNDAVRWNCTLFFYIGELCRYLVTAPPSEAEKRHKIRLCCGNGMRPDVWGPFQARYHIPEIIEFYAATEGNVALFNFSSEPGAVGRLPWYLAHRFPIAVVKFDVEKEQPVRGPDGFCVKCETGEVGEVIGRILNDPEKPANRFEGYADKEATSKKVLHDVFEKGDAYFRTGDLMRQDENGFFYFVDRIGDTFRWKSENVATSEVSEAITVFPGIKEANVYGVPVPGYDGKVGMAAVVAHGNLDLTGLRQYIAENLPEYAQPAFLRIRDELDVTGTFKQRKLDLVKDGFDPAKITDALYFNDPRQGTFVPLDRKLFERIYAGEVRL